MARYELGAGGGRNGGRPDELLPPGPPVSLRRVARLFVPYRRRLVVLMALIGIAAAVGVVSPFLLRAVLDTAIPNGDTTLLTLLVLGMIAVAVLSGAIGVVQTWLSNTIGQRVMHDLRSAVYGHLQRMSLAFFTRTHTGEVQSRIANDIGGIDSVVTSTATSIMSNVTTVLATLVAMVAAQLAAGHLLPLPAAVLPLAHAPRGRGAQAHHLGAPGPAGRHVHAGGGVAVGVGHPARQDDGPRPGAGPPLLDRVGGAGGARGAQPHGRPLAHGVDTDELRDHARGGLLVRRPEHRAWWARAVDRHSGGLHHAPDAPALPAPVAAVGRPRRADLAGDVRAHLRVPRPAGRHRGAPQPGRAARRPRRRGLRGCLLSATTPSPR